MPNYYKLWFLALWVSFAIQSYKLRPVNPTTHTPYYLASFAQHNYFEIHHVVECINSSFLLQSSGLFAAYSTVYQFTCGWISGLLPEFQAIMNASVMNIYVQVSLLYVYMTFFVCMTYANLYIYYMCNIHTHI